MKVRKRVAAKALYIVYLRIIDILTDNCNVYRYTHSLTHTIHHTHTHYTHFFNQFVHYIL
jgi:hypothetical protein